MLTDSHGTLPSTFPACKYHRPLTLRRPAWPLLQFAIPHLSEPDSVYFLIEVKTATPSSWAGLGRAGEPWAWNIPPRRWRLHHDSPLGSWHLTECLWVPGAVALTLLHYPNGDWAVRRWAQGLRTSLRFNWQHQDSHLPTTSVGPHSGVQEQSLSCCLEPCPGQRPPHFCSGPQQEPLGLRLWVTCLPGSGTCPDQPPEHCAQESCTFPDPLCPCHPHL